MKLNRTLIIWALFVTQLASGQSAFMIFSDQIGRVNDMDETNNGNIWVAADNGLFFVNASTKNITQHIGIAGPIIRVKMQGNTIWAGAKYTGLWKYDGSNWRHFTKTDGLASDTINDFEVSAVGHIWVATRNGISQYDGTTFLTHKPFLVNNVTAICTFGGVVNAGNNSANEANKRLDQNVWTNLPSLPGTNNKTTALKTTSTGILYASANNALYSLNANVWTMQLSANQKLAKNTERVTSFNLDGDVFIFKNNSFSTVINPMQFVFKGMIMSLSSKTDSSFWCAVSNGNKTTIAHCFIIPNQTGYQELSTNSLTAGISADGNFFKNNQTEDFAGLNVQGKNLIFNANLWFTGWQGSSANRSTANRTFGNEGLPQCVIGPISNARNSAAFFRKYNRVWKITNAQVTAHKQNYSNPNYTMPDVIATWPGNGDLQAGESQFLAPFVDVNGNDIYEPLLGDYPEIRGDRALFVVYNNAQSYSSFAQANVGLECKTMLYMYDTVATALQQAVFVNHQFVAKTQAFDTLYVGIWNDMEIGHLTDDLVGSDSTENMIYAYNGDLNDGSGNPNGWGLYPPAVGLVTLSRPLYGAMAVNWINGYTSTLDEESHFLLQSRFANGAQMRQDSTQGIGYLPGSSNPITKYQFNYTNWLSISPMILQDKKYTASVLFTNIQIGERFCLDYAYHYTRVVPATTIFESVVALIHQNSVIKNFYENKTGNCPGIFMANPETTLSGGVKIYPNPSNGTFIISYANFKAETAQASVYNNLGQQVAAIGLFNGVNSTVQLYQSGFYYCVITENGKIVATEKLVVK